MHHRRNRASTPHWNSDGSSRRCWHPETLMTRSEARRIAANIAKLAHPAAQLAPFELFSGRTGRCRTCPTRRQTCLAVVAIRRGPTKVGIPTSRAFLQWRVGCRVEPPDHSISQDTITSASIWSDERQGRSLLLSLVLFRFADGSRLRRRVRRVAHQF